MKQVTQFLLIFTLFLSATLNGAETSEPETPAELRFIFDETRYMTPQERLDRKKKMAEMPGITTPLYDLLWKRVEGKYDVDIGQILIALASRPDLTEDQLKRITDRIRTLAAGSVSNLSADETNFLWMGVQVLKKYPSPEHEDLALMLLEKDDESLKSNAALTLGKIGTRKSVDPMRRFVDSRMNQIDPALRAAAIAKRPEDPLLAAQRELIQRVNAAERKVARDHKSGFRPAESGDNVRG